MAIYPRAWSAYMSTLDGGAIPQGVGQFLARYSMAKSYTGSSFGGMTAHTQQNYSLLIRAGLAYSVVESVERLQKGGERIYLALDDADLVSAYRDLRACKLLDALQLNSDSNRLRNEIELFRISKTDDLHSIAASLRHLTFHGVANPHKLGLDRSKYIRICIDDIADLQLDQAAIEFSKYIELI